MTIFDSIKRFFGGTTPPGRDSGDAGAGATVDAGGAPARDGGAPAVADDGATAERDGEMIPCEEALRKVHEYLDGELDGVPATQVRRHFEACGRCYPHLKFESAYREAIRRATAGQEAPPDLKARVVELLAEASPED